VHSSKYTFGLNGIREIEESVSAEKVPSKFQHKVEVPGLAKLTVPAFDKVDKFYSKEYYGNNWLHTAEVQANGEKTLCRRKVKVVE
jgi:hypothetical protein